jgi:hypothetical protein
MTLAERARANLSVKADAAMTSPPVSAVAENTTSTPPRP